MISQPEPSNPPPWWQPEDDDDSEFGNRNGNFLIKTFLLDKFPIMFRYNHDFLLISHFANFSNKFHYWHTKSIPILVFKSILQIYLKYINMVYYRYTMKQIKLAQQIINRQTEVNNAVKKSSKEFLWKIINSPKNWDADIVQAAVREWEIRKE